MRHFASRTHLSTRRLPTTTAKFFRTRMTNSSTPMPCRAHTPHSRPYRTQGCAVRSSPTPAFPRGLLSAVWAGADLADAPFELVTHMGNATRCKPDATYYLEQLQAMGLEPHEVLMVGNDPQARLPQSRPAVSKLPMLAQGKPGLATWRGTMEDFARDFNAVVEAFYEHQVADELMLVPNQEWGARLPHASLRGQRLEGKMRCPRCPRP